MANPRTYNILFLCTGNSARSIFAEALMNHFGGGTFQAVSAGSHPAAAVHPLTLETLRGMGLPTAGLHSKHWDVFLAAGAPVFDFVFTVCDELAGEECPRWPHAPMAAHWGIADPVAVSGDDAARHRAFEQAALQLQRRVRLFLSLPLASIDAMTLQRKLDEIGRQA